MLMREALEYRTRTGQLREIAAGGLRIELHVYDLVADIPGATEADYVMAVVDRRAYPLAREGFLAAAYVRAKFDLGDYAPIVSETVTQHLGQMIGRETDV